MNVEYKDVDGEEVAVPAEETPETEGETTPAEEVTEGSTEEVAEGEAPADLNVNVGDEVGTDEAIS